MMNAYRLPDGRVVVPSRATSKGMIGDGWQIVDANSAEAEEWAAWTVDAPAGLLEDLGLKS